MYAPLFIIVALLWLWLVIGAIYAFAKSYANWFVALCGAGAATVVAAVVLLTAGPYWDVIYATLLQPG